MTRAEKIGTLIGIAVGGSLTWYARFMNARGGVQDWMQGVCLLVFPTSMGYMVAEDAKGIAEAIVVLIVVLMNGCLYASVLRALGKTK